MYTPNNDTKITTFIDYSWRLKYFDTQLNELTNQISIKKNLLSQRIRRRNYKTLGTSEINSPPIVIAIQFSKLINYCQLALVTLAENKGTYRHIPFQG